MKLSAELVKALTGDRRIKARLLYQNSITFDLTYKVMLVTNYLPVVDNDTAIWDRIHEVEWNVRISEEEQNTRLLDDLQPELAGILQWLIKGCLQWQRDGKLTKTLAIQQSTQNYREESDPLKEFIDECCTVDENAKVKKADIYLAYKDWTNDKYLMSQRRFNACMAESGFTAKNVKVDGKSSKCWIGICLNGQPYDDPVDWECEETDICLE